MDHQSNFKVVVRVRPPLPRELSGALPFKNIIAVDESEERITVSENLDSISDYRGQLLDNSSYNVHSFCFDHVYDQFGTQKKIFETTAKPVVDSSLQGYNATIFAYGQTGTGKTYTMEGFNRDGNVESRGIIPRAIEQIFGHIQRKASPKLRFLVRASYLQIYNEQISDLLKTERANLHIREDQKRGVYVEGLSEWVVRSPAEIYGLMERGAMVRATGETKMNEVSSRSHAVFIVIVEQSQTVYVDASGQEMSSEELSSLLLSRMHQQRGGADEEGGGEEDGGSDRPPVNHQLQRMLEDHVRQSFKVGKLNLVDLAGSERVRLSGATGQRLEESKQINKSLSALGNVISALTDTKSRHIPYRDSKLTRILEDSLGGNCKTTMMAMVSPALEAIQETLSTLKFANRAKNIKNEARVNEDLDQKSLLRKYELELKRLRAELEARSKNVVDKRRLLELDEQRRRAEEDKMAAIRALESRSQEFLQEKEEKKQLEQRIAVLMSQVLRGEKERGRAADESDPDMQLLIKQHQDRLRLEYEERLADLEREKETVEEERVQVDRYKQLLIKQRDIMNALTQRLAERDNQIMKLQDELDSYERQSRQLQERLDEKTNLLIRLQRAAMEVNARAAAVGAGPDVELARALEMCVTQQSADRERDARSWLSFRSSEAGLSGGLGSGLGVGAAEVVDTISTDYSDEGSTSTSESPGSASGLENRENIQYSANSEPLQPQSLSYLNSYQRQRQLQKDGGSHKTSRASSETSRESSSAQNLLSSEQLEWAEAQAVRRLEGVLLALGRKASAAGVSSVDKTSVSDRDRGLMIAARMVLQRIADQDTPDASSAPTRGPTGKDDSRQLLLQQQQLQQLREENERLQLQLRNRPYVPHQDEPPPPPPPTPSERLEHLEDRCKTMSREREAVLAILERKISILVDSVTNAVGVVLDEQSEEASMSLVSHALTTDLSSLRRLLGESVSALKELVLKDQSDSASSTPATGSHDRSTGRGGGSTLHHSYSNTSLASSQQPSLAPYSYVTPISTPASARLAPGLPQSVSRRITAPPNTASPSMSGLELGLPQPPVAQEMSTLRSSSESQSHRYSDARSSAGVPRPFPLPHNVFTPNEGRA